MPIGDLEQAGPAEGFSTKERVILDSNYVKKPWGGFWYLCLNQGGTTVKILQIDGRTSLQRHRSRREVFTVISGICKVQKGMKEHRLFVGDTIEIGVREKHRITGVNCTLVEVSFGHFSEEDIERFEDDYGRARRTLLEPA